MNKLSCFLVFAAALLFALESCRKNAQNPFDDIVRPDDPTGQNQPFDTSTIEGLHRYFLKEKCAIPSCHGGTFEPNFLTPLSSWNTLVWAPVIKNTDDYRFRFRVVPGNVNESWLHERCTTDDPILGRMPRYADPLTARELFHLKKWIADGAKNTAGQTVARPNLNARLADVIAFGPSGRIDSLRTDWASPFPAPKNADLLLVPIFYDEETETKNLLNTRILLSIDPLFASFEALKPAFNAQYNVWTASMNTTGFPVGQQIFMRCEAQDTDHPSPNSLPTAGSPDYLRRHFSFVIQ